MEQQPPVITTSDVETISSQDVTPEKATIEEFEKLRQKDVAIQRGEVERPTASEVFADILSSTSQEEIDQKGYKSIGNVPLTVNRLRLIKENPQLEAQLFAQFRKDYTIPEQKEENLAVAFVSPDYETVRLPQEFNKYPERQRNYFLERLEHDAALGKIINNANIPLEGKMLIFEEYSNNYGMNLVNELGSSYRDIPSDVTQTIPTLAAMGASALASPFVGDEDMTFMDSLQEGFKSSMQGWYPSIEGNSQFWNSTIVASSREDRFNRWYKNKFIEKYNEEMWITSGQASPKMEVVFDEQGNPTYTEALDENGNLIWEDNFDPTLASNLADSAWNTLSGPEKALFYAAADGPFVMFGIWRSTARAGKLAKMVGDARTSRPTRFSSSMSDYEVYLSLINEERGALGRNWSKMWRSATLGLARKIGEADFRTGRTFNEHLSNLDDFKVKIDEVAEEIEDTAAQIAAKKADGLDTSALERQLLDLEKESKFINQSRTAYMKSSGSNRYVNPFTKTAFMDEIYISTAMGMAPEFVPFDKIGMSETTGEVLTALAAPFFAPVATRKAIGLASAAVKKTPVVGTGVEAVQELANVMQHSDVFEYLTPAMLINNDVQAIKAASKAQGIEIGQDALDSITAFHKMVRSAKPEYQQRIYSSLKEYSNIMRSTRQLMANMQDINGDLVFTEEEIDQNMAAINLSLAHATGVAPLVAIQSMGDSLRPGDTGSLNKVMDALAKEEQLYIGMDTQLKILAQSFNSKGIDISSNEPLLDMTEMLRGTIERGQENILMKKQLMNDAVDLFLDSPLDITPDTIKELTELKLRVSIDPTFDRIKAEKEVTTRLFKNTRQRAKALDELSGSISEEELADRTVKLSEDLFEIRLGQRYAKGSARYTKVSNYAAENGISVSMDTVVRRMMDMSEELKDKPLSYFFSGGKDFVTKAGSRAQQAFDSMAERGLAKEFVEPEKILRHYIEDGSLPPDATYTQLALLLGEKSAEAAKTRGEDVNVFKFFEATVEEAEDVRRYFRNREYEFRQSNNIHVNAANLTGEYEQALDKLFDEADPTGQLKVMLSEARMGWKKDVGDVTEVGTYAYTVDKGRTRREGDPKEGIWMYRSPKSRPAQAFFNMSELAGKIAKETDPNRLFDLRNQLENEKQIVMQFLGATKNSKGKYAFDLSDPEQVAAADSAAAILQSLLDKRITNIVASDVRTVREIAEQAEKMPTTLTGELVETAVTGELTAQAEKLAQKVPAFDFERAKRIENLRDTFAFNTIETDDAGNIIDGRRHVYSPSLEKELAEVDTLLRESKEWADGYNALRKEVNGMARNIEAARKYGEDIKNEALDKFKKMEGLVNSPSLFFDTYFGATATAGDIANLRSRMKIGGMTDTEIDVSLKAMYVRGLYEKSDHRYALATSLNTPNQELSDITVLIKHVNSPAKREVMEAVLGKEHAKHLERIAKWASLAMGDGAGFRAVPDSRSMSIDSAIARAFNLARGMVSPTYVISEVGMRMLLKNRQQAVIFALSDRDAASVIGKMLQTPSAITEKDINILADRIKAYLVFGDNGLVRTNGEIPPLEIFLGDELPSVQEIGVMQREKEEAEAEQERIQILGD